MSRPLIEIVILPAAVGGSPRLLRFGPAVASGRGRWGSTPTRTSRLTSTLGAQVSSTFLSFVEATARAIAPHLRLGQLVVLESTTYTGSTDDVIRKILQSAPGLTDGKDFHLPFSPEREDAGNPLGLRQIPNNVVGGLTPACLERAGG